MVFNSLQYALFLPVVLGLYWLLRGHQRQNVLLLLASYVFYGAWDYRFLGLMWISTLTDYFVGRRLAATADDVRRKRILVISLAVNLGILGFFKYFNFFTTSAVTMFGRLGVHVDQPTLKVLLPIGISFYTFHGISYTVDVYRRHIEPAHDLLTFAVFVAYFPQLVAGPIGRAHIQLPQFQRDRERPTKQDVRSGLMLILLGLFKKVVIADALAPFVNSVFLRSNSASWPSLILGMYAFAIQIYGDFSGYSDIARGSSRLFGIELLVNFEQPHLARNISEFWQRWHISLSTWLRDYVYISFGGNRGSELSTYRNLMLTMAIGGLWHGAAWTFVVWGTLHGIFLCAHRWWSASGNRRAPNIDDDHFVFARDALPALGTFTLVAAALVVFRSATFTDAVHYFTGIVTLRGHGIPRDFLVVAVILGGLAFFLDIAQRNGGSDTTMLRWPAPARGVLYASFVIAIVVFSGAAVVPFIYFQF